MRMANEMKAGIVIIVAIAIAVLFFLKTADFDTTTYELKTYFGYAGDLKPDAIVKLSGIEVGRVTGIKFIYGDDTKVECVLELTGDAKVRKDAIAYIGTAGFVGDAYVGLTPGTSAEFLEKGGVVASEDPVQMRILMKKADKIADSLNGILADVKAIVGDNKQGFDNIVNNLEGTTRNFEEFSADIKKHPWKLLFKGEE
ncbi:MAG: MCE family protein [Candidatus Omnitrophica bacterium]|nr:MCE family protein [Candidatus Omnitrophota bacterium]